MCVFFFGLGSYGLIDPDEGRYAEIAREMLETGDFVTPRLNYVEYFEKPVLHYWLTAAFFAVLGQNEFAARLTPVLCALGGAWLAFGLARRRWGLDAGFYAAVVLSTGLLWFAIARLNILDMTVSFFITLSLAGFWRGCEDEKSRQDGKSRRYLLLFYGGMALATLSKGLIGIVLPGGVAFWYIVLMRRWRLILRALYMPGIALFFLLTVPWFWAVCRVNDDFFYFFFVQEHFLRYTTSIHDRYEPFWFFIPVLTAGLAPWTGLLPDMLRSIWAEAKSGNAAKGVSGGPENPVGTNELRPPELENEERSFGLFLGLWFAVPFVFFSLSSSKLVPYIVPCLPPLAILGGRVLASIAEGDGPAAKRLACINGVFLSLAAAGGVVYPLSDKKLGTGLFFYTLPASASLALFVFCGVFFYRRRECRKMVHALCLLASINLLTFSRGFFLKAGLDSYKEPAAAIREQIEPADVVVSYKSTAQGLGFYLKRRIVLMDVMGELEFGARQEKDPRWFLDSQELKDLWLGKTRVFLVFWEAEKRYGEEIEQLLGKHNIIQAARIRDAVVLSNASFSRTFSPWGERTNEFVCAQNSKELYFEWSRVFD
ncbi:MAG: glycosyltransferase family 39 protein [Synergistaceae bacterium]|nr:glycosyltransferase family 39 protein [Synergistaceae bacterium]